MTTKLKAAADEIAEKENTSEFNGIIDGIFPFLSDLELTDEPQLNISRAGLPSVQWKKLEVNYEESDAVDALSRAARLSFDDGEFSPHELTRPLAEEGFTITRQPAMTDTELERRATMLVVGIRTGKHNVSEIVELAKKYRG